MYGILVNKQSSLVKPSFIGIFSNQIDARNYAEKRLECKPGKYEIVEFVPMVGEDEALL